MSSPYEYSVDFCFQKCRVFLLTKSVCTSLAIAVLYMQRSQVLQYYEFRDGLPTLPSTECYTDQQIMRDVMLTDAPFFLFLSLFFLSECSSLT